MELKTKCSCGNSITVGSSNLVEKKVRFDDGCALWITCFSCSACGKEHVVLIDNDKTIALMQKLRKEMAGAYRARAFGKQVSEKKKIKMKNFKDLLDRSRKNLELKYDSFHYVDENGNENTLNVERESNFRVLGEQ